MLSVTMLRGATEPADASGTCLQRGYEYLDVKCDVHV